MRKLPQFGDSRDELAGYTALSALDDVQSRGAHRRQKAAEQSHH